MARLNNTKSDVKTKTALFKTPKSATKSSVNQPLPRKTGSSSKKRKIIDLTQDEDDGNNTSPPKKHRKQQGEKRLKTFRPKAPQTFLQKLERAQSQRMIVIGRKRSGTGLDLHEDIDVVGTTGNIYTVTIGREPSCTCPDHKKGNECKHKVYALATVLRADYDLQYQRAFLSSEVQEILAKAPPIPDASVEDEDSNGKRKPVEGECPICYMDFDPDNNELVWCKAACGNNMHKDCFEQWARSQKGQEVKCVYCRSAWEMDNDDVEMLKKGGVDSGDGYVNVAEQFGMSRARDYSSYHQPWVRRNFGYG